MKSIRPLLLLLILFTTYTAYSQQPQKFTISGKVQNAGNGEELYGALIVIKELPSTGVAANEYGFYSISLPQGNYTVICKYLGFKDTVQVITLDKNITLNWQMQSNTVLKEVVISETRDDENLSRTTMGQIKLDIQEINKVPVLFGERDILKTIQLLPGVKSAGEGNSGFYVRGGGTDQNLVLLDEAPVYNASHLLGFFSTFNSDAIKDVTLIKGSSPAQYGGRLASVLDVRMKEGNDKKYSVAGGIGLISSRLSVEGPIQKEKSSFLITGRRTYADVFLKATKDFKENTLYFYDLNAKANYRINEKNRIFLSGYFGRDVLGLSDIFGINWGNKTATLRWNSIIKPKLFSNTSLIYSDYDYKIEISGGGTTFNISSRIQDWNLKQEFQFYPGSRSSWRFGINAIHHTLTPSRFEGDEELITQKKPSRYGLEGALYANHTYSLTEFLSVDYGLRLSSYSILGGDTYNIYNNGELQDSVVLGKNSFGKTYWRLEPRFSVNYRINEQNSLKAAYTRNTQNLHQLSNSTSASPTDQWVGNSYNIKPEIADQVALGYFRNFAEDKFEFSVETYYKWMQNQIDYRDGADLNSSADVEADLLYGKGRAYGLELFLKKKTGRFTGWIGYTLSRTERRIDGINKGNWYAAKQDRTHDVSIVAIWQITERWSVSGLWVYYTGNAVSFPSGKYQLEGQTVFYYTERNGYRMPAYHRFDLSATYEGKKTKKWQSSWNISLYNVYGRKNAYTITFEDDPDDPTRTRAMKTSLFQWVPSVTYNFKF